MSAVPGLDAAPPIDDGDGLDGQVAIVTGGGARGDDRFQACGAFGDF